LRHEDTEPPAPRKEKKEKYKCGVNFSTRVHVEKINATLLGGGFEREEIQPFCQL
jgi:hypothetical protein